VRHTHTHTHTRSLFTRVLVTLSVASLSRHLGQPWNEGRRWKGKPRPTQRV